MNSSCASLKAPSGISNLAVVPLLRTKPIRRNKLCVQEDDSKSICPTYPGLRDINALAVLVAIDLEITLPRLLEKNNILVLGKDFVQGINGTTIYAEKLYKINFTVKNKKFV